MGNETLDTLNQMSAVTAIMRLAVLWDVSHFSASALFQIGVQIVLFDLGSRSETAFCTALLAQS